MKREWIQRTLCGALAAVMALSLAACKPSDRAPASSGASSAAASSEVSSVPASTEPILGMADTDYDGFQYLMKTMLTKAPEEDLDGSGSKGKKRELTVYVPDDEHGYTSGSRFSGEKMGMHFSVDIDPMLQYQAEDYTAAENLDYYMGFEYDPEYLDYADLTVNKAVADETGESARAVVTYCDYDSYEKEAVAYYCTYYLKEINGLTVLVEAEINSRDATGKLPGLLDEIEAYYGFRPEWDAEAAKAMAEKADFSDRKDTGSSTASLDDDLEGVDDPEAVKNADGTFTASNMTFKLPDGWDIEDSDGEQSLFAPDGDSSFSGCAVVVMRQYNGATASSLELFKSNPEVMETMLKSMVESSMDDDFAGDMDFKMLDTAPFGAALKMTAAEDSNYLSAYFIFDDEGYMYIMMAADTEADQPGAAALDTLFASAKQN